MGKTIGKSQQYIAGRLSLLKLATPVQELITTRVVSPSLGRVLATIPDERWQKTQANKASQGELTVRMLEDAVRTWRRKNDKNFIDEKIKEFFHLHPELDFISDAVQKEQVEFVCQTEWGEHGYLIVKTIVREFKGQDWHWPKYSGQTLIIGPGHWKHDIAGLDRFGELPDVSLFSEQEWDEFRNFHEVTSLAMMSPCPGWGDFLRWHEETQYKPDDRDRRTYDHNYGRFIFHSDREDSPVFIKRSWGVWSVIEFNDGQGHRIRRRFFTHDTIDRTLINNLSDTVDPDVFSDHNMRRLNIWKVTPVEMSWFYIRHKTIPKDEAIKALEMDIENLKNSQPLSSNELEEKLLDELQSYVVSPETVIDWREGTQTFPRLSDGSVNEELTQKFYMDAIDGMPKFGSSEDSETLAEDLMD